MSDIMKRLNAVFRIIFEDESLEISESTCAEDIEQWDSMRHLNLLAMIEEEFHMQFEIDDIISMEKVGDIIRCVEMRSQN